MKAFPWWTDEQKAYAKRVEAFAQKWASVDAKTRLTREFPFEIYEDFGKSELMGAGIPKEYGGLGLGATGACILSEGLHYVMPGVARIIIGNMNGGLMQVLENGTEEQKKRFLPDIAGGEIGAVVITEMTAGTDAASIQLQAVKKGDKYILNGKKRFIVGAGVANRYFVYAVTDPSPEALKARKHLTCFIIHKGTPGFSSEKINEILGFENVQNGSLDFINVEVGDENRIGQVGGGWDIMMQGLDFERTNISASAIGWLRMMLTYIVPYAQRRVQFGKPTIEISQNKDKIADIAMRTEALRAAVYYTALCWDSHEPTSLKASGMKAYCMEEALKCADWATQVLGGDGVNRMYPIQNLYELAKTDHIAGGTIEACKITIFRSTLKEMKDDLKMPRRVYDADVESGIATFEPVEKKLPLTKENFMDVLCEDYKVNPGLHMTAGDVMVYLEGDEEAVKAMARELYADGLVMLVDSKKTFLVKANYAGLHKTKTADFYKMYPSWVKADDRLSF